MHAHDTQTWGKHGVGRLLLAEALIDASQDATLLLVVVGPRVVAEFPHRDGHGGGRRDGGPRGQDRGARVRSQGAFDYCTGVGKSVGILDRRKRGDQCGDAGERVHLPDREDAGRDLSREEMNGRDAAGERSVGDVGAGSCADTGLESQHDAVRDVVV